MISSIIIIISAEINIFLVKEFQAKNIHSLSLGLSLSPRLGLQAQQFVKICLTESE